MYLSIPYGSNLAGFCVIYYSIYLLKTFSYNKTVNTLVDMTLSTLQICRVFLFFKKFNFFTKSA
nr:MAG TPA: hypothetical protein [Caudoviricetes sp.]